VWGKSNRYDENSEHYYGQLKMEAQPRVVFANQ
jgi:hypothetical protein